MSGVSTETHAQPLERIPTVRHSTNNELVQNQAAVQFQQTQASVGEQSELNLNRLGSQDLDNDSEISDGEDNDDTESIDEILG